jgi:NAD(P)-dependent dehydrogenase (short-subunit alcohol dehydrogenase family)
MNGREDAGLAQPQIIDYAQSIHALQDSTRSRSLSTTRVYFSQILTCDSPDWTRGRVDYQLTGKTAYVTAGAHGIGRAIADLLAAEGVRVIVADHDEAALREHGPSWLAVVAADLGTADGVRRASDFVVEQFGGPPDILVNNLGVGNSTPFEETTDEQWQQSFEINLMGCVRTCRALVPRMAARGSGAVVNTGSDLAKQPEPGFMEYGSSKAGLLYLTKALAKQYAPAVRVNAVLPGPIWSRMWTREGGIVDQLVAHYGGSRDSAVEQFLRDRQMPMGIGHPEDVAHAVVFLASPLARFITGASIDIGGTIRGLI